MAVPTCGGSEREGKLQTSWRKIVNAKAITPLAITKQKRGDLGKGRFQQRKADGEKGETN